MIFNSQEPRFLLVFANKESSLIRQQRDSTMIDLPGWEERELQVKWMIGQGYKVERSKWKVDARQEFVVILVGKDGTEKFRSSKPVGVNTLFSLIDAMPMRQRKK